MHLFLWSYTLKLTEIYQDTYIQLMLKSNTRSIFWVCVIHNNGVIFRTVPYNYYWTLIKYQFILEFILVIIVFKYLTDSLIFSRLFHHLLACTWRVKIWISQRIHSICLYTITVFWHDFNRWSWKWNCPIRDNSLSQVNIHCNRSIICTSKLYLF